MDVVIFGRVSTLIQDYDRQVNELTAICTQRGWSVRSVFTEKISGADWDVTPCKSYKSSRL